MLRRVGSAALALLAACTVTPSEVSPDARIVIAGTVTGQDATPMSGVPVTLVRHEGVAEALGTALSLGLTCLADDKELTLCRDAKHARSGDAGAFTFTLQGADTQGFLGDASTLEASAQLPRAEDEVAGASVAVRFLVQTERISLPMRAWEPDIEAVAGPRSATVKWTELPQDILPNGFDAPGATQSVVFERRTGEIVWSAPGRGELVTFDARLLEDSRGSISIAATWEPRTVPDEQGRSAGMTLRSGRPAYRSRAGAPPSRGARCAVRGPTEEPVNQSPCTLTDGDFERPMGPRSCPEGRACAPASEAVVDLGRARPVELIVLRGCADACTIETSADRATWKLAATTAAGNTSVNVIEGTVARYVRVSGEVETLRELSVWEPGTPAGSPVSILAEVGRFIPGVARVAESSRLWPIAAAALLLAMIGGALAATVLIRTRTS